MHIDDRHTRIVAAGPFVAFVVGPPRAGKSTAAAVIAAALDVKWVETSAVIAESLERTLGYERGTYLAARPADPEAHRGELGQWGSEMARRNGWSPARIAVARGYRVISGCRRLSELLSAEREAIRRGLEPWVVYIDRSSSTVTDNTDPGIRLHAESTGAVLRNDGDASTLRSRVLAALRERFGEPPQ